MTDYVVRASEQLPHLLQAFRKQTRMTQAEAAIRLGVTQQTLSALERNAEKVSAARLMKLLSILGVELVLRKDEETTLAKSARAGDSAPIW